MSEAAEERSPRQWDTARVEAFSDGVFAIAITLLVLEIRVEPADYHDLRHALLHEWPAYLAYVTSFLTVGSLWIAHHALFVRLRYVDPVLLRINLLLLMVVAFLPFPTGVLAQAMHASDEAERTAVVFYGGTALLIELLSQGAVRYAVSRPELTVPDPAGEPPQHRPSERGWRASIVSVIYGVAILAGIFVFPKLAAAAYLLVAARGVFVVGAAGQLSLGRLFGR
jgi:uncharacterized membrane protein